MATSWVLGKISDALQPTVQSAASTAGSYAGGALSSVGSGISGVGASINGTIKRYGDGVTDYGNGIKDWANAPGPRSQTASNPLGLSGGKAAGKTSVMSPSIYSAPPKQKSIAAKPATAAGKSTQPQKKAGTAPVTKPSTAPVKRATTTGTKPAAVKGPTPVTPKVGVAPAKPTAVKKPAATKPLNPVTPAKASVTAASKPKPAGYQRNQVSGSNPLGLSF